MLGVLFTSDPRSAWLFSMWRKCEAQRIFACFEQAHLKQCSQHKSAWPIPAPERNILKNQTPFVVPFKIWCCSSAEILEWQSLWFCQLGISFLIFIWSENGAVKLVFQSLKFLSAVKVPSFTHLHMSFGSPLIPVSLIAF